MTPFALSLIAAFIGAFVVLAFACYVGALIRERNRRNSLALERPSDRATGLRVVGGEVEFDMDWFWPELPPCRDCGSRMARCECQAIEDETFARGSW